MRDAVVEMVTDGAWKIACIVRSARFFTDGELVNLYKSQLLSYFEFNTVAISHACDTVLARLNQFQNILLMDFVYRLKMRYSTLTWRLYKADAIWPCWGCFI